MLKVALVSCFALSICQLACCSDLHRGRHRTPPRAVDGLSAYGPGNDTSNYAGPCRTHDDCSYNSYCDKWGVDSNFTQCWHCRDCERRLKEGPHFPIDGQCPVRCPLSSETLGDRAGSAEQAHISGLVSYAVLTVLMARLLL